MKTLLFKKVFFVVCCFFLTFSTLIYGNSISPHIHVDQFGYFPNAKKVAVLSNPQVGFNSYQSYTPSNNIQLRRADNNTVVFSTAPVVWNGGATDQRSGDKGWWFDFSSYETEGTYYVYDPGKNERSANFVISCNPYKDVLVAATRMFYYNRCNIAKTANYAGNWTDGVSFLGNNQDGSARYVYDQNNTGLARDLSGGWFDAGDYNKYITFAYGPVDQLLWAYRLNPSVFTDNTNIPESGNGIADIIDELKWELDWMKKMMNADGSVIIKMGNIDYSTNDNSPPSANYGTRYYGPVCTSSSITLAANLAHAAAVFSSIPSFNSYAQDLKNRAITCFNYALPYLNSNTLQTNCDDGTIKAGDADMSAERQRDAAFVAAVHLYDLTNNSLYENYIKNNVWQLEPMSTGFWGVNTLPLYEALLHYTTLSNADQNIVNNIRNSLGTAASNNWNGFYGMNESDLYRAFMPDWSYSWGSNQSVSNYGNLNMMVLDYQLAPSLNTTLKEKALGMLHYLHGVNPLGIVYLSNMYDYGAERSVNEIYHGWFADGTIYDNVSDGIGPAPGYVSGGPNPTFTLSYLSPPSGQPYQKSYLEFNGYNNSWEITEPAIYYQAAYIRNLSRLIALEASECSGCVSCDSCDPNKNLLNDNGDFEDGNFSQWQNWGGISITGDAANGNYAATVVGANGGGAGYGTNLGYTGSEQYVISVNAKVSGSPSWAGFGVHYLDSNGNQIGQDSNTITSTSYENSVLNINPVNGTKQIRIWFWKNDGGTLYLDDFCLINNNVGNVSCSNDNEFSNNNGFESGSFSQWRNWGGIGLTGDAADGSYAAFVGAANGGGAGYGTNFAYTGSEQYVLSVNAKVSGSPSWAGFGVHYLDENWNQLASDSKRITNTSYENLSLNLNPVSGTKQIRVWFWKNDGGLLYVDDFCLLNMNNNSRLSQFTSVFNEEGNASIYPNPAFSKFNVRFNSKADQTYNIVVTDLQGREVKNKSVIGNDNMTDVQLDCSDLSMGTYLVSVIHFNKRLFTEKLVIVGGN